MVSITVFAKRAATAAICLLLCGCTTNELGTKNAQPKSREFFAMDTYMTMKAYGDGAEKALNAAEFRILDLEGELSVTDNDSEISALNNADGKPVTVSDDVAVILRKAREIGNKTGGAMDITLYPIVKEWGFTTGDYHIPSAETLSGLLENVDYSRVDISGNAVTLPADFQVDTGALAKGYASDEAIRLFRENGVDSGIVSLGGNVMALGAKPDGSNWRVSVVDPFAPDTDMCILGIRDKAVITSGNYERYFIGEDGKLYCHIIDSSTGCPAESGLVSVTVIGECGLECDALSTALFVLGYEDAVGYWREYGGFDMILVTDDEKIFYTSGIADSFTNVSDMNAEVIS